MPYQTDPESDEQIFVCTEEDPWNESKSNSAIHPDAQLMATSDFVQWGEWEKQRYKCPHCKTEYDVMTSS